VEKTLTVVVAENVCDKAQKNVKSHIFEFWKKGKIVFSNTVRQSKTCVQWLH